MGNGGKDEKMEDAASGRKGEEDGGSGGTGDGEPKEKEASQFSEGDKVLADNGPLISEVKRVDTPDLNVDAEPREDSNQNMEKYALDNAPPPIKVRREGETSEEACPQDLSPPPSPKRMRELSRKDAINGLPFSKVFSHGSI